MEIPIIMKIHIKYDINHNPGICSEHDSDMTIYYDINNEIKHKLILVDLGYDKSDTYYDYNNDTDISDEITKLKKRINGNMFILYISSNICEIYYS